MSRIPSRSAQPSSGLRIALGAQRAGLPWVYSMTLALLMGVGLLAAVGPTLRAMHIEPVETFRSQ